jgi:hypothetical protein
VQSAAVGSAPVSTSVPPTVQLAGSPPSRLGETSPLPMLSACEVCVGVVTVKSDGSGAEVVTSSSSPVSGVDAVLSFDFGLPVDVIDQIVSTTLVASTFDITVPAVSVVGLEPLGFDPHMNSLACYPPGGAGSRYELLT